VHRTVTTNVLGTGEVIRAAEEFGVSQVVSASTGKALRPYSRDIYTASKRVAESLLSAAARRGGARFSAARFTHVVDNSIVYSRLLGWCQSGVVRLHAPDIMFYAQSALESAQLLLRAGLDTRDRGQPGGRPVCGLRVFAITDLGWPFCLLDMALGVLARAGSKTPVYFSGYAPGYESVPFPGLYDPRSAGDVSPLLNAFEAALVEQSADRVTDEFGLQFEPGPGADPELTALRAACDDAEPEAVRAALDALSWQVLDETLATVPRETLARVAGLTGPFEDEMGSACRQILAAIREHAQRGGARV
jgi:hypothetical protein